MDVFTHFLVPYFLLMLARRPQRERLAAGVGGYAPDVDVLTGWVGLVAPDVYFLGHRGASHSLLGAPMHAAVVTLVLALPFWERRFPRMAALRFSWRTLAIAMLASFTHLALDFTTIWGVPWLFPFDAARPSLNWHFYSSLLATGVGAYVCWRMLRARADERFLRRAGAVLAVVLLATGGARLLTRPATADGEVAQPGAFEWQWTLLRPTAEGWEAIAYGWGAAGEAWTYPDERDPPPEEAVALARAKESLAYRRFHLYSGGPETAVVERAGDGAWNVTFTDLMRRAQIDQARGFLPASEERGRLRLVVDADGAREL